MRLEYIASGSSGVFSKGVRYLLSSRPLGSVRVLVPVALLVAAEGEVVGDSRGKPAHRHAAAHGHAHASHAGHHAAHHVVHARVHAAAPAAHVVGTAAVHASAHHITAAVVVAPEVATAHAEASSPAHRVVIAAGVHVVSGEVTVAAPRIVEAAAAAAASPIIPAEVSTGSTAIVERSRHGASPAALVLVGSGRSILGERSERVVVRAGVYDGRLLSTWL